MSEDSTGRSPGPERSPLEVEAKALRDVIYGNNIPDDRWDIIKHNWIADIQWLRRYGSPTTKKSVKE